MKNRITLQRLAWLAHAKKEAASHEEFRSISIQEQHAWAIYGTQRSRYEKNARRSQRQKRRDARRALANGYNLKAA